MVKYSIEERKELVLLVINDRLSLAEAQAQFHQIHPLRPIPKKTTISAMVGKLLRTGSLDNLKRTG